MTTDEYLCRRVRCVLGLLAGTLALSAPTSARAADVTPPSVSLTSPTSGATFVPGQIVALTASASDNVAVQSVKFLVDGVVRAIDAQSPYTAPWGTVAGLHQLKAVATDAAGNSSTSAVAIVSVAPVVDVTPPSVVLTSPSAGASILIGQNVPLAATASDASGIARVEFLMDGAVVGVDSTSPYTSSWSALAGPHLLAARAIDASSAQNSATSAFLSVSVAVPNGVATCGDGVLHLGYRVTSYWGVTYYEQCDDGNRRTNDGCDANCQREFCDDGLTQPGIGEACDGTVTLCTAPGGYPGTHACRSDCSGFVSACTSPLSCGDGICTAGAESVSSCPGDCPSLCGDGLRTGTEACDDGNLSSLDGCSAECTLDVNESARLPVVQIVDGDGDGLDNDDIVAGLGRCAPGCILRAPAGTFRNVTVDVPNTITDGLILEGAGMDQTIFRAPVPVPPGASAVLGVIYPNRFTLFRDFTVDGRKAEQPSLPSSGSHTGISVRNPWTTSTGPGRVERVRIRNVLNGGFGTALGENWVIDHSVIQDIGCSDRFPCPALPASVRDPYVPDWQTTGAGIVTDGPQGRGLLAHHNTISNVVKMGLAAYGAGSRPARDFTFRDNLVYNTGSGIASNGGINGTIAANLVEAAHSSGITCGAAAGQLVIERNMLRRNHVYSISLMCDGGALTLRRNTTKSACPTAVGVYNDDVLLQSNRVNGTGSGLQLIDNVFGGGACSSALVINGLRDIVMDGTTLKNGHRAGMLLLDVQRMSIADSVINGEHPVGILIYQGVHSLSGQVTIQNAEDPVLILYPAATSNITLQY